MEAVTEGGPFDEIGQPEKRAVLAAYTSCASVTGACEAAGISRSTHYVWMLNDEQYKAAFARARPMAAEALEDEATKRAVAGSDVLLIFRLKGEMPEKYRERFEGRLSNQDGSPLIPAGAIDAILDRAEAPEP